MSDVTMLCQNQNEREKGKEEVGFGRKWVFTAIVLSMRFLGTVSRS